MRTPVSICLSVSSALLLAIFEGISGLSSAVAVTTDGPFTIYSPTEVDCEQTYTQTDKVESHLGRQPVSLFCSKLTQGNPFTVNELQVDQARQLGPWSEPYQEGDYICRDRGSGYETVCLYPDTAQKLNWFFIQAP